MSAIQGVLPGMEAYWRVEWRPQPHKLAEIQNYLRGYEVHGRPIYAKRRHIAAKLGIGIRTLSRYLAYLKSIGWIATVQRTARTAIRKVVTRAVTIVTPVVTQAAVTPAGTSKEATPESRKNQRRVGLFPSVVFVFKRAVLRTKRALSPKEPNRKAERIQELLKIHRNDHIKAQAAMVAEGWYS